MTSYERLMHHTQGMTDFAKLMFLNAGGNPELFEDPGAETIVLGDMSDICSIFSLDDLINLSPEITDRAKEMLLTDPSNTPPRNKPFVYRPFIKL